ncbi:MAG: dTMP kinase [Nanoarchaeota archaeon]|nr:dTMP kinase [Nanoarchaeota archaeon]
MKGKFIVIEGIDGCGSTTQSHKLAQYIFDKDKKNHVVLTREPANSEYMVKIRELLASNHDPKENAEEYTRLFVEDRKHHLKELIEPALKYGSIIICDRYKYSTLAYQQAQGIELARLIDIHKGVLIPNLTIIIDVPVDVALERLDNNKRPKEAFEEKDFMEKLRQNYLKLKQELKNENIVIIDGSKPIEVVFDNIKEEVEKVL